MSQSYKPYLLLLVAGVAGVIVWEIIGNYIAPLIIGGKLSPIGLIISLFKNTIGINPGRDIAMVLHFFTGIVGYPVAYLIATKIVRSFGPIVDGLALGVGTWILALGVFAPLAGFPFMLNFGNLTWMSLGGHVVYGLVVTLTYVALLNRKSAAPA